MACHAVIASVDSVLLCVKEAQALSLELAQEGHCHSACHDEQPTNSCGKNSPYEHNEADCDACLDLTLKIDKQVFASKHEIDSTVDITSKSSLLLQHYPSLPIPIQSTLTEASRAPPIVGTAQVERIKLTVLRI